MEEETAIYECDVKSLVERETASPTGSIGRAATIGTVALLGWELGWSTAKKKSQPIVTGGKILLQGLNTLRLEGYSHFLSLLLESKAERVNRVIYNHDTKETTIMEVSFDEVHDSVRSKGLITVSNHMSTADDPCIPGALVPWGHLFNEDKMR